MLAVSIFVGKIFDHGSVYVCPPHGLRTDKWLKLIKNKVTFYFSLNLFWLLNPAVSVLKGKGPQNRCRNRSESKSEIIQTFRLAGIPKIFQKTTIQRLHSKYFFFDPFYQRQKSCQIMQHKRNEFQRGEMKKTSEGGCNVMNKIHKLAT